MTAAIRFNHQSSDDHQNDAGGGSGNGKGGSHVGCDGIDLTHVADTEGSQQAESREQHSQYGTDLFATLIGAETVL